MVMKEKGRLSIDYRAYLLETIRALGYSLRVSRGKWVISLPKNEVRNSLLVYSTKTNIPRRIPYQREEDIRVIKVGRKYAKLGSEDVKNVVLSLMSNLRMRNHVLRGQRIS